MVKEWANVKNKGYYLCILLANTFGRQNLD